ncbi:MAG: sel1 repeat family protein, partial [Chromatiales bacterium]|nr:sel1 repeat family protein [Chromatiales bacterium]
AARQGHGLAQHGLGVMYLYGECVGKDESEAARWFRHAADQGLAGALMTLGMMYEQGLGVERDADQARRLYAQAESTDEG